jgi:hypothetical protein
MVRNLPAHHGGQEWLVFRFGLDVTEVGNEDNRPASCV